MKLDLSKDQFRELLGLVLLGATVKAEALESKGDRVENAFELEQHLLRYAPDFGMEELVQLHEEHVDPSETLADDVDDILDQYDEACFWNELEVRLGQRDFLEDLSQDEREGMEDEDEFPESIHGYYDRYAKEFDRNGLDRLVIDEVVPKAK